MKLDSVCVCLHSIACASVRWRLIIMTRGFYGGAGGGGGGNNFNHREWARVEYTANVCRENFTAYSLASGWLVGSLAHGLHE